MSNNKKIEAIFRPEAPHMVGDGFRVFNYFPNGYHTGRKMSPFFLLDYNPTIEFNPSERPRGVGVHPHRGFETVTIAWKGRVAHRDSAGHSGVINPGDVQWMTAASGILHKEYHEKEFSKKGGEFQMAQIWVNLPRKHKMDPPGYQAITSANIAKVPLENDGGIVNVIAGEYRNVKGPARTFTPINMFDIRLNKGGSMEVDLPAAYNTGLLVAEGHVKVNGQEAPEHHFVLFGNEGEHIVIEAAHNSVLLLLNGEPINEPVFHYGPFVMNTAEDIQQAIDDFNSGKFGHLEDEEVEIGDEY